MSFLLDTNICSAHMRRPAGLAHRFVQHSGRLQIPTVVLAELYAGAFMLDDPTRILTGINDLLQDLIVLAFDEECARQFGLLRGDLKRAGIATGPIDLQIASVALVHDLTLVTHNTADFQGINGLRLEDWLTP
jgi:tRNA(fMet)-specific endonuclease VapC